MSIQRELTSKIFYKLEAHRLKFIVIMLDVLRLFFMFFFSRENVE